MSDSDLDSDDSMPALVSNSESESDSDLEDLEPRQVLNGNASVSREDDDAAAIDAAIKAGQIVAQVHSIQSRPELNGRSVHLLGFNAERTRYEVEEIGGAWERASELTPWRGLVMPNRLHLEGAQVAKAAAMRQAAQVAATRRQPEPEPETEQEDEAAAAQVEAEVRAQQKKERKKERKKEQQRRARERKRQQQAEAAEASELPPIEELTARERMDKLEPLINRPVAEWSTDHVAEWVRLIELDAALAARGELLMVVLRAFADEEIDGLELRAMSGKRLQRMLRRQEMADNALMSVTYTIVELRDALLATQRAVDDVSDDSAPSAELAALKAALEKEKRLRVTAEEAKQEAEDDVEDCEDQLGKYMMSDRKYKAQLSDLTKEFIVAEEHFGFHIPMRMIGELDCDTRTKSAGAKTLPECVSLEGRLGLSELQSLVNDVQWHPEKTVIKDGQPFAQINWEDERLRKIEKRYPNSGVAKFVYECWCEIREHNASGSYMVKIPWNIIYNRQMTPAEAVQAMCNSPNVKKKKQRS